MGRGRRAELWRSIFSLLSIILLTGFIYFLLKQYTDKLQSTSDYSTALKNIVNFMKDLLVGICSMGILIQSLRMLFSYIFYANETITPPITNGVQGREVEELNVADALEDFISSNNQTVPLKVTSPQIEQSDIVKDPEYIQSLEEPVTRVIRVHDDSENHDTEPENTILDNPRRIIRS